MENQHKIMQNLMQEIKVLGDQIEALILVAILQADNGWEFQNTQNPRKALEAIEFLLQCDKEMGAKVLKMALEEDLLQYNNTRKSIWLWSPDCLQNFCETMKYCFEDHLKTV